MSTQIKPFGSVLDSDGNKNYEATTDDATNGKPEFTEYEEDNKKVIEESSEKIEIKKKLTEY